MSATARSASKIMLAVMGSRILGLVREMVLNSIFGAGKELDAFIAAFRIPNLLRDLFAEGALSTAFVTTFSKKLAKEDRPAAFRLANLVMSSMCVVMCVIVLLGVIGSPWLVPLIAPGFESIAGKTALTIDLTRILFPFILVVSLAAVYMGLLNSLGSFGLPASASTAFNAASILSGLAIGYFFDPHFGPRAIYGFAIGAVFGGLVQLLIQVPRAVQFGYRFAWKLDWRDKGLRQVFFLTLPAIMGSAAVQINVLVNTWFASYLGDGAVTWLNNAFRLMQLPIGMFGVAIAAVTLPAVSQSAAAANFDAFRSKVMEGLKLALFLTIPASIGLAMLASPIIALIYQRGAFTAYDTSQTALALQAYTIGLASYACLKVIAPVFYALDLPGIPVKISIVGIILNVALNYFFIRVLDLGILGLPLSTSLVALLNFLQLLIALRLRLGRLGLSRFVPFLLKLALAALIMAASVYALDRALAPHFSYNTVGRLLFLSVTIAVGLALFLAVAAVLRMKEISMMLSIVKRKQAAP
ncbi:MAG: murein biosynthesis integral membrane protein MurJ [bacterium]